MEHAKERFALEIKRLEQSLLTLQEAMAQPESGLVRDASIQRFEYVVELSWKSIQAAMKVDELSCLSPREAFREAYKREWIDDFENWMAMVAARNSTSHLYNEDMAKNVYEQIKNFPPMVQSLIPHLKKFLGEI